MVVGPIQTSIKTVSTLSDVDKRLTPTGDEMTLMTDLLDELMAQADAEFSTSVRPTSGYEAHECDGCGETLPEVDLYAEDSETGEEVWLCLACGEW